MINYKEITPVPDVGGPGFLLNIPIPLPSDPFRLPKEEHLFSRGPSWGHDSTSGQRPSQPSPADLPQSKGKAGGSSEAEELTALNPSPPKAPDALTDF